MADPWHVELVKFGSAAINEWRAKNPSGKLDLENATLEKIQLFGVDLSHAKLRGANLTEALLGSVDLMGADLAEANLTQATLPWCNLISADLRGTKLKRAQTFSTNMNLAKLNDAILEEAGLLAVSLNSADLTNANLTGANLRLAVLFSCTLSGAKFTGARFGLTSIGGCDLTPCIGLEAAVHDDPSSIGIDTLVESFRTAGNCLTSDLEVFFRNAGVANEILLALPQIIAEVKYSSCFVCYGEPDLDFATKLAKDLKARGVSCWLYAMDATPGERTWPEISRERREAEKMIVLCSAATLVRDGALKEIEEQIDEDPNKMIPVSLDDIWKEEGFAVKRGKQDLKPFLLDKNYADFSDSSKYNQSLNKLLNGLKRGSS
jgi:hypothetical protein